MDKLFGSLTTYEMRTTDDTFLRKEAPFNTTKKGKEVATHKESSEESNAEVENFVKKLKEDPMGIKESYHLNVSTMVSSDTLLQNVPTKKSVEMSQESSTNLLAKIEK